MQVKVKRGQLETAGRPGKNQEMVKEKRLSNPKIHLAVFIL